VSKNILGFNGSMSGYVATVNFGLSAGAGSFGAAVYPANEPPYPAPPVQTVYPVDLTSLWHFDEGSGITASDAIDSNPGTLSAASGGLPTWTTGKFNGALLFNGNNQWVGVSDNNNLDLTTGGTVMAWIKLSSYVNFGGVIHKGDYTSFNDECYSLQLWNDSSIEFDIYDAAGTLHMANATTHLQNGVWYFVVGTWDTQSVRIYVNGVREGAVVGTFAARTNNAGLNLGGQAKESPYYTFGGIVDEPAILGRGVSDAEVKAMFMGKGLSQILATGKVSNTGTGVMRWSMKSSFSTGSGALKYQSYDEPTSHILP
jgi:hypothetical protein